MTSSGPPAYDIATSSNPRAQLHGHELASFVLDGPFVCSAPSPTGSSVPLYEITKTDPSKVNGNSETYEVRKLRYRLTSTDGEGDLKSRVPTDPIYYFRTASLPWLGDEATIFSARDDGTLGGYKAAVCHKSPSAGVGVRQALGRYLVPGQWTVADHFVITTPHVKLLGKTHEVNWADEKGKLLAVESKSDADGSFRSGGLPVLDLKVSLGDRARDFLVVCWIARIWKDVLKLHDEFVRQ